MYKRKDITFTETKYICIWGYAEKIDGTLVGNETWEFQKVTNGTQVSTARQYIDQFNTYAELMAAFPNREVPPENMI